MIFRKEERHLKRLFYLLLLTLTFIAAFFINETMVKAAYIDYKEVDAYQLNVRTGPSTDFDVITRFDKGQKVTVIDYVDDWVEIQLEEDVAYVHGDFLSFPSFSGAYDQYDVNTDALNVRRGPGTDFLKDGKVNKGDRLSVYSINGDWAYVKSDSLTGYVHTDFIDLAQSDNDSGDDNKNLNNQSSTLHTVSSGETLYAISNQYNTTIQRIKTLNNLSSNFIYKNQQLIVSLTDDTIERDYENDYEYRVNATYLTVRKEASINAEPLTWLKMGTLVSVVSESGEWAKIIYAEGSTGYVHKSYLVQTNQSALFKKRIVIDAGHGAKDPGAMYHGISEKDVNLAVSLKVKQKLIARGATVLMTRDDDTFIELHDRSKLANNNDTDLFLSIHFNAHPSSDVNGIETYWHNEHESENSERLATNLQNALISNTNANSYGVKSAGFVVIKHTKVPSALVELAFLSNTDDAEKAKDPIYQETLANALVEGIIEYYQK